MRRVAIQNHGKRGVRIGDELGNLERDTFFTELLIGAERCAENVARNGKLNAPGTRTLTVANEDVDSFVQGCAMFLKEDGRLCMRGDGCWNKIHLLQFDGVIGEPSIGNDFVA
jgi:hypothetical protein